MTVLDTRSRVARTVTEVCGQAPRDVIALDVAMLVTLFACAIVTRWWKISLHSAVSGGAVATLALLYGPLWLAGVAIVVQVGWSRVAVGDHTVTQVIAGALIGPILGGAIFLLVR